jgi:arabinan endo-1,5-alpha-L-arabinosidase
VGRATSVTGPYYDKSGVAMTNNGGTAGLSGVAEYVPLPHRATARCGHVTE